MKNDISKIKIEDLTIFSKRATEDLLEVGITTLDELFDAQKTGYLLCATTDKAELDEIINTTKLLAFKYKNESLGLELSTLTIADFGFSKATKNYIINSNYNVKDILDIYMEIEGTKPMRIDIVENNGNTTEKTIEVTEGRIPAIVRNEISEKVSIVMEYLSQIMSFTKSIKTMEASVALYQKYNENVEAFITQMANFIRNKFDEKESEAYKECISDLVYLFLEKLERECLIKKQEEEIETYKALKM